MYARSLKSADVAKVTGYSRFRLNRLFKDVFGAPSRKGERSQFTPHDLLVISVLCTLEQRFGVKRPYLRKVSSQLRAALRGPRAVQRDARLVVIFDRPSVTFLSEPEKVKEGLVLPLREIFSVVDQYLGIEEARGDTRPLAIGPGIVAKSARSKQ